MTAWNGEGQICTIIRGGGTEESRLFIGGYLKGRRKSNITKEEV